MTRFKKLLIVVDTRNDQHSVVETATEFVLQNASSVSIIDVVSEMSWIVRKLAGNMQRMLELYVQEVRAKLESLAATLRNNGIDVTTNVLTGKTSVEVVREVLREKHDLIVASAWITCWPSVIPFATGFGDKPTIVFIRSSSLLPSSDRRSGQRQSPAPSRQLGLSLGP